MKLSIEEKAKAYDKALEIARKINSGEGVAVPSDWTICETIFPELKESEDEKIRKWIIDDIRYNMNNEPLNNSEYKKKAEKAIAWLEKQDQQDNNEDEAILHRFSFYSYKDEPNILYLAGLYVNDKYRNKGIGTKILEVTDEVAKSLNCHAIRLKTKKDSNAERLYRTHGYNSLITEEKDGIWLEKQGEHKLADKLEPKFKVGNWVMVSTTQGDKVVQIASVEYFKDGHPSYITTEGRCFGNGTKARLLTDKDVETITLPESKVIVNKI